MKNLAKLVRQQLKESFENPLQQQLASKAEQERINYRKELQSYKADHDAHMTIHERRELLGRVSLGLDQSKRNASDFEQRLKELLEAYGL
jgi:hypothetical protein